MAQLINFLPSNSSSCGVKAIAPIVAQNKITVAANVAATNLPLITTIASGQPAISAGQISNSGCIDLQVSMNYLNGSDCDSCTVDTITLVPVTFIVPAGSVFPAPSGLISSATYTTGTYNNGVFTAGQSVKPTTITYYSEYQPCCDGAILVP